MSKYGKKTTLGYLTSAALSFGFGYIGHMVHDANQERAKFAKERALEGLFVQYIPKLLEHPYSIAEFKFDKEREMLLFNGRNFGTDGFQFEKWNTVASAVDHINKKYYYMYEFEDMRSSRPYSKAYGLGVMDLDLIESGGYLAHEGSFLSVPLNESREHYVMAKVVPDSAHYQAVSMGLKSTRFPNVEIVFEEVFGASYLITDIEFSSRFIGSTGAEISSE